MSTYSAGKVSVTPRGQYSALTQYERLDVVSDNGSSYMYINKTPATGVSLSTTTHWMEIAQKGEQGLQGPQGPQGDPGQDGSGVPAGGTAGQVLSKIDATDHNVAWADQTGGGQNILHNWDFRNPVNQRGVSGTISTGTYFYDRWIRNSGTVTVNAGYLTIANGAVIEQRIEGHSLAGDLVTVSVKVGTSYINGSGTFPTSAGTASITLTGFGTATLGYNANYMFIRLTTDAARNLVSVKCEMGKVSTLQYDKPAEYAIELLKCQRFFFAPIITSSGMLFGTALCYNPPGIMHAFILPTTMRTVPSINHNATKDNLLLRVYVDTVYHAIDTVIPGSQTPSYRQMVKFEQSGGSFVQGKSYAIIGCHGLILQFSADL